MRYLALVAVVLLSAGSCTFAKISGRSTKPLLLNNPTQQVTVLERLDRSEMRTFDYTGAFDVSEIIAEELARSDADAVANLTVTVKATGGTFFVNLFTLSLANARVFQVEGDLISYGEGGPPQIDGTVLGEGETVREALEDAGGPGGPITLLRTGGEYTVVGGR